MPDLKKLRRLPKGADLKRGQIACCIELSPAYVAVILQRAKDAGLQPRLADV